MAKTPVTALGIELGKNNGSLAGLEAGGAVVMRPGMTDGAKRVRLQAAGLRGGNGGLLRGALPRADVAGARPRSAADRAGVCSAVREGAEDRRTAAAAIAEAATRPTMRLVTLKSAAQLDLQVLNRARQRLARRTDERGDADQRACRRPARLSA